MSTKRFPLTSIQNGMWFHAQSLPNSGADVQQIIMTLSESLDIGFFTQAWQEIANQYAVLRSSYTISDIGEPIQYFAEHIEIPVAYYDWLSFTEAEQNQKLSDFLQVDRQTGFQLDVPPLMRVSVFQMGSGEYRCVWTFYHIQLDGRSHTIVLEELFQRYDALITGEEYEDTKPRPFTDYLDWLSTQTFSESKMYWQQLLKEFTAPTPLIINRTDDYPQIATATADVECLVPVTKTEQLQSLAEELDVTMNTLLHGAWALLLHHYSNEKDVVFGTLRACRDGMDWMHDMVGVLINTLPMRSTITDGMLLKDYMQSLRAMWVDMRPHEYTPLSSVQTWSETNSGEPLFHSLVSFENYDLNVRLQRQGENWQHRLFSYRGQKNIPLTLMVSYDSEIKLRLEFDPALFNEEDCVRLLGHLETLLLSMPTYADKPPLTIPYLTEVENQKLLEDWNPPYEPTLVTETVQSLFSHQAAQTPEKTAVRFQDETLTYRQLNAQANQLAHYLQEQGLVPGSLVGIFLDRSFHTIISMLAVLKSGAAYVPLDPIYPRDRLAHMISDSQMPLILTESSVSHLLPDHSAQVVIIDDIELIITMYDITDPELTVTLDDLAYVIYTSGSTGKPKGVQVPHRGLTNFLLSMKDEPGLTASDVLVAVTTISFDIAELEMYLPLIVGGELVIVPNNVTVDGRALAQLLADTEATILQATPATWHMLLDSGWNGRSELKMLCGGEPLPRRLADTLLASGGELWNMYGPTETTIWSSISRIMPDNSPITIGKPILNTSMYILDENLQLVPSGVIGELYIGGLGVTQGYLNRPELTAEKFLKNPFRLGDVIYKTGDLARFNPDGTIECLGRIDHQVKIRGFRIELGEIETRLRSHPAINQSVVLAREDNPGDKRLVAYLILNEDHTVSTSELHRFLLNTLPDYMVPANFVTLNVFPQTPNGKINRKALPAPNTERPQLAQSYIAPQTETEKFLASVWSQVLKLDRVGIEDNFFELGGNSLLNFHVVTKIKESMGIDLPIVKLFQYSTIHVLAKYLDHEQSDQSFLYEVIERSEK